MAFQLSDTLNKDKVFLVKRSELEERLDCEYYNPSHYRDLALLGKSPYSTSKLKDICVRIVDGPFGSAIKADDYVEDGIPFIRVADVTHGEGTIKNDNLIYISHEAHKEIFRSKVIPGDVVIAKTGATMGAASVVPDYIPEANIRGDLAALTLLKDCCSAEYAITYINTQLGQRLFWRLDSGGTRGRVVIGNLKKYPVVVPPHNIQYSVVAKMNSARADKNQKEAQAQKILDSIDTYLLNELGIEAKSDYPNAIENRIVKSSFRCVTGQRWDPLFHCGDMFAFVRNAQHCIDFPQLNNLVQYFQTGFAAGRDDQGDECSGIIQIRPTNINDNRELVFHRNVYIDASELNARKADVLNRDEVLFNNTNSQEQVGKTSYFDLEGDYFCSNHITRIATKAELLNSKYLCYILNLYQHQKCFFKLCTNWNNQSGVGVDVLQKIPIPLPPLEKQNEIAAHIQAIRNQAKQLRAEAAAGLEEAKREVEAMIIGQH